MAGEWRYTARLYPDTQLQPGDLVTVDAELGWAEPASEASEASEAASEASSASVQTEVLVSPAGGVVVVRVTAAGVPVVGARVRCAITSPGHSQTRSLQLRDNGLGYPDITAGEEEEQNILQTVKCPNDQASIAWLTSTIDP